MDEQVHWQTSGWTNKLTYKTVLQIMKKFSNAEERNCFFFANADLTF